MRKTPHIEGGELIKEEDAAPNAAPVSPLPGQLLANPLAGAPLFQVDLDTSTTPEEATATKQADIIDAPPRNIFSPGRPKAVARPLGHFAQRQQDYSAGNI